MQGALCLVASDEKVFCGKDSSDAAITFAPFHPDLIYILDNSEPLHGFIFGPLGPYHSALSLFAYRLGIERSRYRGGRGEVA